MNTKPTVGNSSSWKKSFFTIWIGQQLSWIGSAVAGFAVVWWLTETTGSATVLAIGTLIKQGPRTNSAALVKNNQGGAVGRMKDASNRVPSH